MDKNDTKALWIFLLGYFSAIAVMMIADQLSGYLSSLESSGVIVSPNGNESDEGEKVTSLVKEYTKDV